jgi:hypothetical protein
MRREIPRWWEIASPSSNNVYIYDITLLSYIREYFPHLPFQGMHVSTKPLRISLPSFIDIDLTLILRSWWHNVTLVNTRWNVSCISVSSNIMASQIESGKKYYFHVLHHKLATLGRQGYYICGSRVRKTGSQRNKIKTNAEIKHRRYKIQ